MPQSVDTSGLDQLMERWDALLNQFPAAKRQLLARIGPEMLARVRQEIGGTGKVAGWQALYQGSGGGYAAVRPRRDTWQTTKSGRRYAVGYITNAIEGGHRHGNPRGGAGYRPRVHVAAVPGRWFYDAVRQELPDMAEADVRALTELIVDGLEGDA